MTTADDFARATQLHQQGNLPEAEKLYRQVLTADPKHAEAWHMLGLVAHQVEQYAPAVECIENALRIAPQNGAYYHNLAIIHHRQGQHDRAGQRLEQLLKLEPTHVTGHQMLVNLRKEMGSAAALGIALRNLGNALSAQGQRAEALSAYHQALELRPRDVELLNNLGVLAMDAGDPVTAIAYYRQAVVAKPGIAELHNNLGNALCTRGEFAAAESAYREALRLKPNYPKCANNLGVMFINSGRYEEAVQVLHAALQFRPDLAELQNNLGVSLKNLGRIEEALLAYRQALTSNREFVDAHHNLGNLLLDLGQLDKAALAYRQAIQLVPDEAEYHRHLALVYKRQGDAAGARQAMLNAVQLEPDDVLSGLAAATSCPVVHRSHAALAEARASLRVAVERFTSKLTGIHAYDLLNTPVEAPFNAQFFDGNARDFRTAYAELFAPLFVDDAITPIRDGQPRVGFVVTKGHEGVFLKSLRGVIERLDRELCLPVILCAPLAVARIERELSAAPVEVMPLPDRGDRLVEAVRAARLDILYHWEVGTDAINYFLPMFRLAAVQCTSWGIQQTSGIAAMDYYLSSALVEPSDAAQHYREQLLLADTLLTYQYRPQPLPVDARSRADFGFRDDQHMYTCAQHLGKFHPDFDETIGEILDRDAHGVFIVTEDRYRIGADLLRERWQSTLHDVSERIIWLPRLPEQDYRALLAASDVLLDPPHFGGVNSTYDALALAKPVVTCPSNFQRGRYTLGCYQKLGMLDCVARDARHYVELALALGTNADQRRAISEQLLQRSEALWEDASAITAHERMFEQMLNAAM